MLSDIQQLLACRRLAIDTPQAVEPGEFGTSRGIAGKNWLHNSINRVEEAKLLGGTMLDLLEDCICGMYTWCPSATRAGLCCETAVWKDIMRSHKHRQGTQDAASGAAATTTPTNAPNTNTTPHDNNNENNDTATTATTTPPATNNKQQNNESIKRTNRPTNHKTNVVHCLRIVFCQMKENLEFYVVFVNKTIFGSSLLHVFVLLLIFCLWKHRKYRCFPRLFAWVLR